MATFTVSSATGQNMANLFPGGPAGNVTSTITTGFTEYRVQLANGTFLRYNGSFFFYDGGGVPTSGLYTSVDITDAAGNTLASLTNIGSQPLVSITTYPLASLLSGGDSITGGAGNDTLTGQFGFDTMNGGGGIDTNDLSFFTGSTQWNMATGAVGFNGVASTETAINFENAIMGSGADSVTGTTAANDIQGGAGADTIDGGDGADTITGGADADSLLGGIGNDVFIINANGPLSGVDFIDGGANTDRIRFTANADVSGSNGGNFNALSIEEIELASGVTAIINSSAFTAGGIAANVALISGGAGAETLQINPNNPGFDGSSFNLGSWGANDIVFINGQLGSYSGGTLTGTSGRDSIVGYINADTLAGGSGDDTLYGNTGSDSLSGGFGDDLFRYNLASEIAADTIDGSSANTSTGDAIFLNFAGAADFSTATILSAGGASIESLDLTLAGGHAVTFNGSQFNSFGLAAGLTVSGGTGTDTVTFNNVSGAFNLLNLNLQGWAQGTDRIIVNATGAATITGTTGDDSITGSAAADSLIGGFGNDTLTGGDLNDTLNGGAGADSLTGGFGDDVFAYGANADIIGDIIDGGPGATAAGNALSVEFSGQANFRTATLAPTANIGTLSLTGGGTHSVDFFAAQAGGLLLSPALNIIGDSSSDIVTFYDAAGLLDLGKFTFQNWTDGQDRVVINAVAAATIIGTERNDSILGSAAGDSINGGLGDDTMEGRLGADTLRGGAGSDAFAYVAAFDITGDEIDGGVDAGGFKDRIQVLYSGAADFTAANIVSAGTTSIERLALFNGGVHDVLFNASQVNANGLAAGLGIQGDAGANDTITFQNAAGVFDISGFGFSIWTPGTDKIVVTANASVAITGTTENDSITGSAANDTISGGLGTDTLDGGAGVDTNDLTFWANGVTWDMTTGIAVFAGGPTEQAINFERAWLGAGADSITGNTLANDIIGGIGNDTLNGGDGNDMLVGGNPPGAAASAAVFTRAANTNNNSIANALAVGGAFFNLAEDANTAGSARLPHASVQATADFAGAGSGITHFYKVSALAGDTLIFDIDATSGFSVDTVLRLFDPTGALVSANDDSNIALGAGGSTATGNSFIAHAARLSGDYVIEVARFLSGSLASSNLVTLALDNGAAGMTYTLNISRAGDGASGGADSLVGGNGVDTLLGGSGSDTLNGGAGIDIIIGGDGDDVIEISASADFAAGEQIDGGLGNDELRLGTVTLGGLSNQSFISSIEVLRVTSGATATVNASNFSTVGFSTSIALASGSAGVETLVIAPNNPGFSAAGFNLAQWGAEDIVFLDGALGGYNTGTLTGSSGRDSINGYNGLDTLEGGAGDDTINGGTGDDNLNGGLGGDSLNGGANFDVASYSTAGGAVSASLFAPGTNSGEALGDTYTLIEGLIGSSFNDTLAGDINANRLDGGAGNDTLDGGLGADSFEGGADFDTASYANAAGGVLVTLFNNTAFHTGEAIGDTFSNVEGLSGSGFTDYFYGTNGDNALAGNGGDDYLYGNDGVDTITGGEGSDNLFGGDGGDVLDGGNGYDFARYDFSSVVGFGISMVNPGGASGEASGDSFIGIEGIFATAQGDAVAGDNNANSVYGLAGADVLRGLGGGDFMVGGAGADFFVYDAPQDGLDAIDDFATGSDKIAIIVSGFGGGLIAGGSVAGSFVLGAGPFGGSAQFYYTGLDLYWDANGTDAGSDFFIARLNGSPLLTAADFILL